MTSKVYFADLHTESADDNRINKIIRLFKAAELNNCFSPKDLTAIKVHFGEMGNDTFVAPWYIRTLVNLIKETKAKPFVTDTNTLYIGHRKNAVDHLETAMLHGFTPAVVGAPIMIADGLTSRNYEEVSISKKHFEKVKIASDIKNANSMLVVSHFKGHVMAGFGGAIKNLAMGCAPAAGKRDQHSARPVSDEEKCTGCGACVDICPESTITLVGGKSQVDSSNCVGCGECISHCPEGAMTLNWQTEIPDFIERLTEYAYGAWKPKESKIGFINFLVDITPNCDCMSWSETPIVKDIGILASTDPIALDKACFDLVNQQEGNPDSMLTCNHGKNEDKFKGIHDYALGERQLSYGASLGLGSEDYELIKIK